MALLSQLGRPVEMKLSATSRPRFPKLVHSRNGGREHPAPRILVTEDDEDVRQLLVMALESEGYDVDEAATAEEGLRFLKTGTYHVILTDFTLPRHTGVWMLQEADRLHCLKDTPALIVTAHPNPATANFPIFRKPIDLDTVLAAVREVVESRQRRTDGRTRFTR